MLNVENFKLQLTLTRRECEADGLLLRKEGLASVQSGGELVLFRSSSMLNLGRRDAAEPSQSATVSLFLE